MTTEVVKLRNLSGHALYCVLEEPTRSTDRKLACLLLSPGVKTRVAPHRLYRKLAQPFLDRGIAVLRADFHGLGDSEGELPEIQLNQLYREVQLGRHVQDARAAVNWLQHERGFERFIVGGLCGGAITGLLAAEDDPRVVGLYAVGIPVILDGQAENGAQHMTRGQLASIRRSYLRKLLNPKAWWRIVTLRSDFGLISHSLGSGVRGRKQRSSLDKKADGPTPSPTTQLAPNLNREFAPAYFHLLQRGARILLLFSGADRLYFEYQEKFVDPWGYALEEFRNIVRLAVIQNANHVLGDAAWVDQAKQLTAEWLSENFE